MNASSIPDVKIPFFDLVAQFAEIEHEVREAIDGVFATQRFILGPEVEAFEKEVAAYCDVAHAIGVSSGSDALLVALMALGIGPGDEVITTPYSFFASSGCIARLGAKPVFVDIDPTSWNIDATGIEAQINDRTRAILPVHLFGYVADMTTINAIANRHGIAVIEDAAQAIGAEHDGRRVGGLGTMACLSFFPTKNLGGIGDGGMVLTNDQGLAEKIRILRSHGAKPKYYHSLVGGNYRLDAIQAAVLRVKLRHLDKWTAARQTNAALYGKAFSDSGLDSALLTLPYLGEERHVINQYVIRTPYRDYLKEHLSRRAIGSEIYYPCPIHLQECFAQLGYGKGDFPEAEQASGQALALPVYPGLKESEITAIVSIISLFLDQCALQEKT